MIDPGKITPLLSNMTVERQLSHRPSGDVYLVSRNSDGKKLALKHISVPASESETKALIYGGAVKSEAEAQSYYSTRVKDLKEELLLLNGVKNASNLLKFRGYQVDQKYVGLGYDVYLLSDYRMNLWDFKARRGITRLQAVNLAIDLCAALSQLRSMGLLHKDVHPRNIFVGQGGHFVLGDLGIVKLEELRYSAMDDVLVTEYTAPEVRADNASLSENMDIYSVGMILYEIYNGGTLPLNEEGTAPADGAHLVPPDYADVAMSEIISKACAHSPEERYETPEEMHQALMLYLQRGDVSDQLLVPPQENAPDDASVDLSEIAATVEAGQAAEGLGGEEYEDPAEDLLTEEASQEPSGPKPTLNDLKEDDLMVPDLEEMSVEDFMASLRGSAGLEVLSMDSEGNMTTVPGYETEESLPDDTEFMDSADNHFAVLQNLAELENAAEEAEHTGTEDAGDAQIGFDADDLTSVSPDFNAGILADTAYQEQTGAQETAKAASEHKPRRVEPQSERRNDDVNVYDDGYEEEPYPEEQEKGAPWKKILITVIVLLVLAGGTTALYFLKTDTVRDMKTQVLSSTTVTIQADTKNDTPMEVICSNATGEVARVPFTKEGATFTDLTPDTTYSFSMASTDGKLLLGSKTVSAKTKEMTNITGFAPTSLSAVSASLALGGVGPQPELWIITLTSDSGENLTFESSEIPQGGIVVDGLTPETHYTAVVSTGDGGALGGTTTCEFTTMAYTELSSFEVASVTTDSVSLTWSYSGTIPDSWTVTVDGADGYSDTQQIVGKECVLSGLTTGETYNITLSAPSLKATDLATLSVGIPAVTVTDITAVMNDDGEMEVSWKFTGDAEPKEWRIAYAYAGAEGMDQTPTTVTSDTNSVVLKDLIPDTTYVISVVGADELNVDCQAEATCATGKAEAFTSYGCKDAEMTLGAQENNPDKLETPSTEFTTDQHIKFSIEVTYEVTEEDKHVTTTYVIRNSDGIPVQVYNGERNIPGTWTTAEHTGELPNAVTTPGSYTLEVYFDGDLLAAKDFTVS